MNYEILKLLENDARLGADQIAVMLDIDKAEVEKTIAEWEQNGTVLGYKAIVDWEKTDKESVTAMIDVKLTPSVTRALTVSQRRYTTIPR